LIRDLKHPFVTSLSSRPVGHRPTLRPFILATPVQSGSGANAATGYLLQQMNAPDSEWVSYSRILPTYSKIKPWQRATKVPQNAPLLYAKYQPTPAGRNMLVHPSVVRNPVVPCCRRSAPAALQVQSGRFQRQKLGKTCLVLALKCWRGTATDPEEARCSIN
jgi:hypothetical protein